MNRFPEFIQKLFLVLFLSLGGNIGFILVGIVALYLAGGVDLINTVWRGEEEPGKYGWLIYVAAFMGGLPGAAMGGSIFYYVVVVVFFFCFFFFFWFFGLVVHLCFC